MKVCFGHQSVGANIIDALSAMNVGHLDVIETTDPGSYRCSVLGHFRVGRNGDPLSKCQAFAHVIDSGVGEVVDVALFKFCYVDIGRDTNVEQLFKSYQDTIEALSRRYPAVSFLHVTVPIRLIQRGVRGWLRHVTGYPDQAWEDQLQRHRYNQLLRKAYADSGRLFDIAMIEATSQDGASCSVLYHDEHVPNMAEAYTDDGGHLNQRAARFAAEKLLECLSAVWMQAGSREGHS